MATALKTLPLAGDTDALSPWQHAVLDELRAIRAALERPPRHHT